MEADDRILEYFTAEFEIPERFGKSFPFLFAQINRLIPALLERKHGYARWALEDAAKHNRNVLDRLNSMIAAAVASRRAYYRKLGNPPREESMIGQEVMHYFSFSEEEDMVAWASQETRDGIVTNLVRVEAETEDVQLRRLIGEVNGLYDQIRRITPKL